MTNKSRDNKAVWSRDISIIFYDLCIREVELGNRPTTHFNKEGWNNVINGFKEKTGRAYGKTQLKSRWDNIKKDWKLWKELKQGSTGLGWSNIKNTIDAPDEWWNEKLQVLPAAKRFRYSGIDPELEEKLDQMYSGVVAMGLHARSVGMDNPPPPPTRLDVDDEQSEGDIRGSPFEGDDGVGPSAPSTHRVPSTSKRRRAGSDFVKETLSSLAASYSSIAKAKCNRRSSAIGEAMKIFNEMPELRNNIDLLLDATTLLENPARRDIFLNLLPEMRIHYIRRHITSSHDD